MLRAEKWQAQMRSVTVPRTVILLYCILYSQGPHHSCPRCLIGEVSARVICCVWSALIVSCCLGEVARMASYAGVCGSVCTIDARLAFETGQKGASYVRLAIGTIYCNKRTQYIRSYVRVPACVGVVVIGESVVHAWARVGVVWVGVFYVGFHDVLTGPAT